MDFLPREGMVKWKGLPFSLPIRDGHIIRYTNRGDVVFDVPFRINPDSSRLSSYKDGDHRESVFFVGCSYTFGTGVLDSETLPSQVALKMPGLRSYNFGVNGATPIEALLRLQMIDEIPEPKSGSYVIYTFISDHLRRYSLALPYLATWGKDKPVYHWTGNGFHSSGTYREIHPLRSWFLTLAWKSGLVWFIYPFFDLTYSAEEKSGFLSTITRMDSASRKLGAKYIFLIWPGTRTPQWLQEGLSENKIRVLDLSKINLRNQVRVPYIPVDLHPSPEAYKFVADRVVEDLKR